MTGCQCFMTALSKWHRIVFFIAALIAILIAANIAIVKNAYAQNPSAPATPQNTITIDCSGYQGFTKKIVSCIENILVSQVGTAEFGSIRDSIKEVVKTLIWLYLLFFGYQVALGAVQKPMSEVMIHLLKITAVAYFSIHAGIDLFYPIFKDAQKEITDMVSQLALIGGTECADLGKYADVWTRIDCLVAAVLGADLVFPGGAGSVDMATEPFKSGSNVPWVLPGLVLGLAFSSIGLVVFTLAVVTIVIVILGFASAVVYYIMCLVALIVLMIIAPIMIPMLLFKTTKGFFDTWLHATLAYIVQPAVLFAYLAFMTQAMSIVIYGGSAPQQPGQNSIFGLHKVLAQAKQIIDDPNEKVIGGIMNIEIETKDGASANNPPSVSQNDIIETTPDQNLGTVVTTKINISDDLKASLLVNLLAVTMIAALLNSFMYNVMQFGSQLAGIPSSFNMGNFTGMFNKAMSAGKKAIGA